MRHCRIHRHCEDSNFSGSFPDKPLNLQVNGHMKETTRQAGLLRSDDEDDDEIDEDKLSDEDRDDGKCKCRIPTFPASKFSSMSL